MNELIKVNYENDKPTILARDLYEFLEVKTAFKDWFPRMCEYGFTEHEDFNTLKNEQVQIEGKREVVRQITDYQLTMSMAKELSMIQRNDKGKQARQYFIKLEEAWNTPEMVMARAIKMAENKIKLLETQIEEQKPLILFAETVTKSCDNILMRDMAKLCCDQKISIGEKRLYKILRNNEVLMCDNTPYQSYIDRQYFVVKESSFNTPYGEKLSKTTLVTPKGQIWIIGKLKDWLDINND